MHMGSSHVLVDFPTKGDHLDNFAAILNRLMAQHAPHLKIIIRLTVPGDESQAEKLYRRYTDFKMLVDGCPQAMPLLALGPDLPTGGFFRIFEGEKVYAV